MGVASVPRLGFGPELESWGVGELVTRESLDWGFENGGVRLSRCFGIDSSMVFTPEVLMTSLCLIGFELLSTDGA